MVRTMYFPMLLFMHTIRFVLSTSCSLDLPFSTSRFYSPSCKEGENCCGSAFHAYLYALGFRANHTGLIFLNPDDQRSCLAEMEKFGVSDVFYCGFDRLTSGNGGCSDYSVGDVTLGFQKSFDRLARNCKFSKASSERESNEQCRSCKTSWNDITNECSMSDSETEICQYAVLVSLLSIGIDDELHINRVYSCLLNQDGSPDPVEPEDEKKSKMSAGIWILMGCLIGVVVISIVIIIACRRRSNTKITHEKNAFRNLKLKQCHCQKFPLREVYSATENLSNKNLIGEGTAGKVYKGLINNQDVAIKHIINDINAETVAREVKSLSHVRHPNLVALLGYCARQDECFLVYEFCPNGNLSEWIFGKDRTLSWTQRIEIAIDSARGLSFLHTFSEGCIVHRDIKPTNILLGPDFKAKLSDFGLSKVINLVETCASSEVRGTFGYVDPEYQNNRLVTSSGDVYSFGIVLLQILSGKKVIDMDLSKPMPLGKMAKTIIKGGSITEFADRKLEGEYSAEAFVLIFQLALSCTALKQQRPSMEEVVKKLEEALDVTRRAKSTTPESTPDWHSIQSCNSSLHC